jgi:hypothetical protein
MCKYVAIFEISLNIILHMLYNYIIRNSKRCDLIAIENCSQASYISSWTYYLRFYILIFKYFFKWLHPLIWGQIKQKLIQNFWPRKRLEGGQEWEKKTVKKFILVLFFASFFLFFYPWFEKTERNYIGFSGRMKKF